MVVLLLLQVGCERLDPSYEERQFYRKNARPGMSEDEVRSTLGEPYREYTKESAPWDYYVNGYEYKKREVTHKVLIYLVGDTICYVYTGPDSLVEEVFIGGS